MTSRSRSSRRPLSKARKAATRPLAKSRSRAPSGRATSKQGDSKANAPRAKANAPRTKANAPRSLGKKLPQGKTVRQSRKATPGKATPDVTRNLKTTKGRLPAAPRTSKNARPHALPSNAKTGSSTKRGQANRKAVDRRQLDLPFLTVGDPRAKTGSKALRACPPKAKIPEKANSRRAESGLLQTAPIRAVSERPRKRRVEPPTEPVSPIGVSMERLQSNLEQEQQRRAEAALAAEAAARAMPVGVRRGRILPRAERSDDEPSSRSHNFDALERALAASAVIADAEAVRGYLNPWLNGRDVLAFVPADRAALIGSSSVAVTNQKRVLIVLPSEPDVSEQVLALSSAGIIAQTLPDGAEEAPEVVLGWKGETSLVVVVSLDRLLQSSVFDQVRELGFDLLVIDEGQRVSELAPDFDPSLERLADLAPKLGRPPTLALLRAVPPSVRSDLPHRLGLRNPLRVDLSPVPDVLVLDVRSTDPGRRLPLLTEELKASALPAVVLGYSMADVGEIQSTLAQAGFDARRLDGTNRPSLLDMSAPIVWVVATGRVTTTVQCAHTLIHYRTPPSLEQYCRDFGWLTHVSGRSRSLMIVASDDESLVKGTLERQRPRPEDLAAIATVLVRQGNNSSTVLLDALCPAVGMNRARVETLVGVFARAGWIDHSQDWVRLRADCPDLLDRARGLGARLKTARERDAQRLRSMSAYVISRGCRQESLRRHFGTAGSRPCGLCDGCRSGRVPAPQSTSRPDNEAPDSSRVVPVELRSESQTPPPAPPPETREPSPPAIRRRIIRL